MEINYLSIPKLRRRHPWSLGRDKYFHLTLNWTCDYLSKLGLKLNLDTRPGILKIQFRILYQEQLYTKHSKAEVYWAFQSSSISDYAFYPQSSAESCNLLVSIAVIILGMDSANEGRRYFVMSCLTGWAHAQNDHWDLSGNPIIAGTQVEIPSC